MDLYRLELFIDVFQKGSFAAVARDRLIDPSSVSRHIAILEQELGLRLFQRTTRKLSPTEAGVIFANFQQAWHFRKYDSETPEYVPIHPRHVISSPYAIAQMVHAGAGISLLADWMIGDWQKNGELVDIFPDYQVAAGGDFDTALWFMMPSRQFIPARIRSLMNVIRGGLNSATHALPK